MTTPAAPRKLEYEHRVCNSYKWDEVYRDVEAKMIGQMAMDAHERGEQFAAWPTLTRTEDTRTDSTVLKAVVWAIPR